MERHLEGVQNGAVHAPWKDEVWEREHPPDELEEDEDGDGVPKGETSAAGTSKGAGGSPYVSLLGNPLSLRLLIPGFLTRSRAKSKGGLAELVRCGAIKVGDVLSFKRRFILAGFTVEKDALVHTAHPKTGALTLFTTAGPARALPPALLVRNPDPDAVPAPESLALREMHVSSATQIEHGLTDLDGRLPRSAHAAGNAWKSVNLWRWPAGLDDGAEWEGGGGPMDEETLEQATLAGLMERGGRECFGTLFYLRGSYEE